MFHLSHRNLTSFQLSLLNPIHVYFKLRSILTLLEFQFKSILSMLEFQLRGNFKYIRISAQKQFKFAWISTQKQFKFAWISAWEREISDGGWDKFYATNDFRSKERVDPIGNSQDRRWEGEIWLFADFLNIIIFIELDFSFWGWATASSFSAINCNHFY